MFALQWVLSFDQPKQNRTCGVFVLKVGRNLARIFHTVIYSMCQESFWTLKTIIGRVNFSLSDGTLFQELLGNSHEFYRYHYFGQNKIKNGQNLKSKVYQQRRFWVFFGWSLLWKFGLNRNVVWPFRLQNFWWNICLRYCFQKWFIRIELSRQRKVEGIKPRESGDRSNVYEIASGNVLGRRVYWV